MRLVRSGRCGAVGLVTNLRHGHETDLRIGFEVLGFRVWGLGFGVWALGFRV